MEIDLYNACPCGSGKKIKFCCCKDIVGDLDKLVRVMSGDQRLAALELANRLIDTHGERDALLAMKTMIQLRLGEQTAAEQTIARFVEKCPGNSVALGHSAMVKLAHGELTEATDLLQRAFAVVSKEMPIAVYHAAAAMVDAQLAAGNYLPARAHLLLIANIGGIDRESVLERLFQLESSPEAPLLFKQRFQFSDAPADAPWKADFDAAVEFARRGAWRVGLDSLLSLTERAAGEPALWRDIAILRGFLGQSEEAAAAWRRYAALDAVDEEDGVEAEALAQLLDPAAAADDLDDVSLTFTITGDVDALLERLTDEPRLEPLHGDLSMLAEEGQPPPRAGYSLLDRPTPELSDDLAPEQIPLIPGEALIYGRETDRPARARLMLTRGPEFDRHVALFREVLGEHCGEQSGIEEVGKTPQVDHALSWRWRLPNETPAEQRDRLIEQRRADVLTRVWPELRLASLGDRSAREAVASAEGRRRVAAAILLLELSGRESGWQFDFNALRRSLGLSPLEPIDPTDKDLRELPLARLPRVRVELLSDEQLGQVHGRLSMAGCVMSVRKVLLEAISRQPPPESVDLVHALVTLARSARTAEECVEHMRRAREVFSSRGEPIGMLLLAELEMRLRWRSDPAELQALMLRIRDRHINEPGVGQGLYSLLLRMGLIGPDGQLAAAPVEEPQSAEAGKLWTPDAPAGGTGGGESKLWVPGMD